MDNFSKQLEKGKFVTHAWRCDWSYNLKLKNNS
jgi:hypothetical protein